MLSKDVDECVTALLKELVRFQDRMYQKDPMKARMKRRIVMGLREVLKHLKLRKVKCVVISPNCERIQSKGTGLYLLFGIYKVYSHVAFSQELAYLGTKVNTALRYETKPSRSDCKERWCKQG